MATTLFEDKLSEYLGIADKASHGYYISNGVYHQNLEKVDVNKFVIAVKSAKKMFKVAFENQENLITQEDKLFGNEAFWNGLKNQQKRFDSIKKYQLGLEGNKNNVVEIVDEVQKGNQQVIKQLKNAIEYHLTILPLLFFRIFKNKEKVAFFEELQSQLIDAYLLHNVAPAKVDFNISPEIPSNEEILSWFTSKEEIAIQNKAAKEKQFSDDKTSIENEKQNALDEANKQIELANAQAKKAQEDALKMMAEMQKKYGLD